MKAQTQEKPPLWGSMANYFATIMFENRSGIAKQKSKKNRKSLKEFYPRYILKI
jgi:hypothetical protein